MEKLERVCRSEKGWALILKGVGITRVRRRDCREPHVCRGVCELSAWEWAGLGWAEYGRERLNWLKKGVGA